MMRSGSPIARPTSPAVSEISVGSPSPPLVTTTHNLSQHNSLTAFQPLSMKRARLSDGRVFGTVPTVECTVSPANRQQPQPPQCRKSSAERVKSFSIADILGKGDAATTRSPSPQSTSPRSLILPQPPETLLQSSGAATVELPILPLLPRPQLATPATQLSSEALSDRLATTAVPLVMTSSQLLLDVHGFPKSSAHAWQAMRSAATALPLRPFLPPALLHYEQRLAWDYQRQLQEHFQAQAQLLRQMSMDPSIIPSEDGSERSHSSSTGSECCSPGLSGAPTSADGEATAGCDDKAGENDARKGKDATYGKSQKGASDTPLDALFQLSTKNFDDGSGKFLD
ncbi:uncharacterized protein LOC128855386 [Anastrepha ludens]|uniref:uncharacterized protein LOC128855386 n=1 Tax=Anastrepha ludens TaxID=28586 RepID=UPI0023AFD932|nr:uncharacterized protein LOC128855386 [Anastrepha ludens]